MTPDQFLEFLIEKGAAWVRAQRELHRPEASPLRGAPSLGPLFGAFFDHDLLAEARFKTVPRIENPDFYRELEGRGQPAPPDFSNMVAITLADTVLLSRTVEQGGEPIDGLVFHELVHVVQYKLLGIEGFVRRYVTGWTENGYDYKSIPLEQDAYRLQARYEEDPGQGFPVRAEIARSLGLLG